MKRTIYWYPVYGPCGQDFLVQLCVLNSQLDGGDERRRGGGRGRLWVGHSSHLGGVTFHVSHELRHVELVKEGEEIFLNGSLDGV